MTNFNNFMFVVQPSLSIRDMGSVVLVVAGNQDREQHCPKPLLLVLQSVDMAALRPTQDGCQCFVTSKLRGPTLSCDGHILPGQSPIYRSRHPPSRPGSWPYYISLTLAFQDSWPNWISCNFPWEFAKTVGRGRLLSRSFVVICSPRLVAKESRLGFFSFLSSFSLAIFQGSLG